MLEEENEMKEQCAQKIKNKEQSKNSSRKKSR